MSESVVFMSSASRLPPELIDECFTYLDYTYKDHMDNRLNLVIENRARRTLKSCAMTCRSWAGIARRHIFRVWNLTFSTESRKYSTLEQVLSFLQDYSDVAKSVRWLRLRMARLESSLLNIHRQSVRRRDCPGDLLVLVLRALPRLTKLVLEDVVLSPETVQLVSISRDPINLHSLELIYDRRGEPEDVATSESLGHILSLFGGIDTFCVCDYMGNETSVYTPDSPAPFPESLRIKRFLNRNINSSAMQSIITGLAASPSVHVLTHLCLGDLKWSHLPLLQSFLGACAQTLTSLHIGLTLLVYENRPVEIPNIINLTCCHKLQNLGFSCIMDDTWFEVTLLSIIAFLLPICPRPRRNVAGLPLRRFCLDVWASFTVPLEMLRDSPFAEALDGFVASFTTLQEMPILITTNLAARDLLDDEAITILQQTFPQVHAKGILQINDVTVAESIDFLRRWL